jgi:hypothetical protein
VTFSHTRRGEERHAKELISGFDPREVHVGFVVDRVALGKVFLRVLRFYLVPVVPTVFRTHQQRLVHFGCQQYHQKNNSRIFGLKFMERGRSGAENLDGKGKIGPVLHDNVCQWR